ncbi:MAG: hypothetical protein JHC93_04895 [Parachlamydiales bacterium]|nr:hypothetical protein [Parachlamydiales bacterium]
MPAELVPLAASSYGSYHSINNEPVIDNRGKKCLSMGVSGVCLMVAGFAFLFFSPIDDKPLDQTKTCNGLTTRNITELDGNNANHFIKGSCSERYHLMATVFGSMAVIFIGGLILIKAVTTYLPGNLPDQPRNTYNTNV